LVTLSDRLLSDGETETLVAINEEKIWRERKVVYSQGHCLQRGLKNIELIDLSLSNDSHTDAKGLGEDSPIKQFPFLGRDLLGVKKFFMDPLRRKDDGGGDHRASQRTPSRLVEASDSLVASILEHPFEKVLRLLWQGLEEHGRSEARGYSKPSDPGYCTFSTFQFVSGFRPFFYPNPCSLAFQVSQIEEFGSSHLSPAHNIDMFDSR